MTTKTIYIAKDGRTFGSAAEVQAHEAELARRARAKSTMKSYVASDYAGIKLPNGASLYYGYEVTQDDEWCFRAQWREHGVAQEAIIPFSKLGARDSSDCAKCLLEGIAKLFESGAITFTE